MSRNQRLLDEPDVSNSTASYTSTDASEPKSSLSSLLSNRRNVAILVAVVVAVVLLIIIIAAVSSRSSGSAGGGGDQPQAVVWPLIGAAPPCGKENCGADCAVPPMWSFAQLPTIPRLPSPFLSMDGTNVSRAEQWKCRRAETAVQLQTYELGMKPSRPATVTGVLRPNCDGCLNGTIVVTVGDSPSIVFTATYLLPSIGAKPYPAMIGIGGISLTLRPILDLGVATINFPNNALAEQNSGQSRGRGLFYTLYGANHTAGALMAWSWGVSRLIDVLEADSGRLFDTTRLGVTGCSRNGKGALVVGAYDERIALTIPQESGSGGSASWRLSDWQGTQVQTLGEITGENVWFADAFKLFNAAATKLPFDHHMLEGMVAPRGLLIIENSDMVHSEQHTLCASDGASTPPPLPLPNHCLTGPLVCCAACQVWLGNITCWGDSVAGNLVYRALGVGDSQGVSQVGGHNHCAQPVSQQPEISAYITRFLLGKAANTSILYTDRQYPTFSLADWAPWPLPNLAA